MYLLSNYYIPSTMLHAKKGGRKDHADLCLSGSRWGKLCSETGCASIIMLPWRHIQVTMGTERKVLDLPA